MERDGVKGGFVTAVGWRDGVAGYYRSPPQLRQFGRVTCPPPSASPMPVPAGAGAPSAPVFSMHPESHLV